MLVDDDWNFLTKLVLDHWILVGEPLETLKLHFDSEFLGDVKILDGNGKTRASRLIMAIKTRAPSGPNSPILQLLKGLKVTAPIDVDAELTNRLNALSEKVDAFITAAGGLDPYSTYLLTGNRVFMNRTALRKDLKHLMEKDDKLVMKVLGERQSGTSYTKELVRHLTGTESFNQAYVNLEHLPSARDAIEFLASTMKDDAVFSDDDQDTEKWIRKATRKLITIAQATGENWCFVLDQCNHVQNEKNLIDMINRLAEHIHHNARPKPAVRLMLLGHKPDLTDELRGRVMENKTRALTQSDVRQVLRTVAENAKARQNPADLEITQDELDARINDIASGVWNVGTKKGSLVTRDLGIALEEAINEHFL